MARSPIVGFADDVVVRVRAEGQGSKVDARSSSRYGSFDFGANAILSMRYDANEVIGGVNEVLAYGTAVVVEKVN